MSTLLEKIRSRGYWRVVIRPKTFVEERIANISGLYPIIQTASVELRGWDFPHVDPHAQPHLDVDWVGQESEWSNFLEVWRIYQSGQFADISGMWEDWRDQDIWGRPPGDWKPGGELWIVDLVLRFTEIFEFAARLSLTDAGDEIMHIDVTIHGLQDRCLVMDDPKRWWSPSRQHQASISELPYRAKLPRADLVANPRELALQPAVELLRRFGWDPGLDALRDFQARLPR